MPRQTSKKRDGAKRKLGASPPDLWSSDDPPAMKTRCKARAERNEVPIQNPSPETWDDAPSQYVWTPNEEPSTPLDESPDLEPEIPGENYSWCFLWKDHMPRQDMKYDRDSEELLFEKIPSIIKHLPEDLKTLQAFGFRLVDNKGEPYTLTVAEVKEFLNHLPKIHESSNFTFTSKSLIATVSGEDVSYTEGLTVKKYFHDVLNDESVPPTKKGIRGLLRKTGNGGTFNYKTDLQGKQKLPFRLHRLLFNPLDFADPIDGINLPQVLCGSSGSISPLHVENCRLFSINFCVFGLKLWLFFEDAAGEDGPEVMAERVTKVVQEILQSEETDNREKFLDCDALLASKLYYAHPDAFHKSGINVRHYLQRPNDFVFISQSVFHLVLNLERCCCIAVNFVPPKSFFKVDEKLNCQGHPICTDPNFHNKGIDMIIAELIGNAQPFMYVRYRQYTKCKKHKIKIMDEPKENLRHLPHYEQLKMAQEFGLSVNTHTEERVEAGSTLGFILHMEGDIVYIKIKSLYLPVDKTKIKEEVLVRHFKRVFLYSEDYKKWRQDYEDCKNREKKGESEKERSKRDAVYKKFFEDEVLQFNLAKAARENLQNADFIYDDSAAETEATIPVCKKCREIADELADHVEVDIFKIQEGDKPKAALNNSLNGEDSYEEEQEASLQFTKDILADDEESVDDPDFACGSKMEVETVAAEEVPRFYCGIDGCLKSYTRKADCKRHMVKCPKKKIATVVDEDWDDLIPAISTCNSEM